MPLWIYDENDNYIGEYSTAYPAPAEILTNLSVTMPAGQRLVDVPPLTPEFYHIPDGADGPVARPVFEFKLDKDEVVADGRDRIFIAGVPVGTAVQVYGPISAEVVVGDDSFTMGFVYPGAYQVRFTAPPHRSVTLPFKVLPAGAVDHGFTDRPDVTVEPDLQSYAARAESRLVAALTPKDAGFAAGPAEAEIYLDALADHKPKGRTADRIEAEAAAHGVKPEELATAVLKAADDAHAMTLNRIAVIRAFRELVADGAGVLDMDAFLGANGLPPLDKVV